MRWRQGSGSYSIPGNPPGEVIVNLPPHHAIRGSFVYTATGTEAVTGKPKYGWFSVPPLAALFRHLWLRHLPDYLPMFPDERVWNLVSLHTVVDP